MLLVLLRLQIEFLTCSLQASCITLNYLELKLKDVRPVFDVCGPPEHSVTRAEKKTRLRGSDDGDRNCILTADHKSRDESAEKNANGITCQPDRLQAGH